MIEVVGLTKRFGPRTALDEVSFTVHPGVVTGFVGPNGAGKTTTMRIIMGLVHPTAGRAVINGRRLAAHPAPMRQAGALLDPRCAHPGRTARDHLRVLAATHGIGPVRVEEMIELTGLGPVADRRVGRFSLGMRQRLGIAGAMLGDPESLVLDEPVNGLDPDGVVWLRGLLRDLAARGRTVLISSHLMSELERTVDHVIVLGRGKVLADATRADLVAEGDGLEQVYLRLTGAAVEFRAGEVRR